MKARAFRSHRQTRNPQSKAVDSLPPGLSSPPAGLYIHFPFCLSKCPYCGFYSVAGPESVDAFVQALLEEIRLLSPRFFPPLKIDSLSLDTIYFGGGTPSLLPIGSLEKILNQIHKYFNVTTYPEITFEINPGDGDLGFFQSLFNLGINRLSLGVQSFDDRVLRFLRRRHFADQARQSIHHARKSGFKNLGLDLIYGIPGQTTDAWLDTLKAAVTYSPEHLSCYELTVEKNTPFALEVQEGTWTLPDEENQTNLFFGTAGFLEAGGYIHYEVSNFARGEEYFSRHNQKYWDHTPYIGLGPSAHSFDGGRRRWNHRSIEKYIAALAIGNLPVDSFEDLTWEQKMLERIYFGMRTKKGIDLQQLRREFQVDWEAEKGKTLSILKMEGLITIQNGVLSPTRAGLAVADRLALI